MTFRSFSEIEFKASKQRAIDIIALLTNELDNNPAPGPGPGSPFAITCAQLRCANVLDTVVRSWKFGLTLLPALWLNRYSCLGSRGV